MGSKRTSKLKKSLLRSSKGRSALRHREKPAKPEIVRKSGLVSEFNNNICEDGLKILKTW